MRFSSSFGNLGLFRNKKKNSDIELSEVVANSGKFKGVRVANLLSPQEIGSIEQEYVDDPSPVIEPEKGVDVHIPPDSNVSVEKWMRDNGFQTLSDLVGKNTSVVYNQLFLEFNNLDLSDGIYFKDGKAYIASNWGQQEIDWDYGPNGEKYIDGYYTPVTGFSIVEGLTIEDVMRINAEIEKERRG